MGIQKKHGKGRLDKWYKLAKEKGYRARAAFKLIQLNKRYHFLENSKVLIDLCAAPGSWCQVAAEVMPSGSLIVGVDLAPIKAIPRVITFQSDITTENCRSSLRGYLKTWKADTVLHDGAPNVGTAWVQDAFTQAELVLQSLKLATEFLREGGTFVTKVFRSRDFNNLLWVFNQLFQKVESTKPPSSRNVSAEIFVVCKGFKAPKKLDAKFLDPKSVFEELPTPSPNNEAKVFKPKTQKRKRDGYEEGDYTQFKELPASKFIETNDPVQILGSINRLSFPTEGDLVSIALTKMPETTPEVRACCNDLRILGKRDFRLLLKWRLSAREKLGFGERQSEDPKSEEVTVTSQEDLNEEERLSFELSELRKREQAKRRREKRKANEAKRKEILKMQLHMITPTEIGLEQQNLDSSFHFNVANGVKDANIDTLPEIPSDVSHSEEEDLSEEDSDSEADQLERTLDSMYNEYVECKRAAKSKSGHKKSRISQFDEEWTGFASESDADIEDGQNALHLEDFTPDDELSGSDIDGDGQLNGPFPHALSRKASMFFEQSVFSVVDAESCQSSREVPAKSNRPIPENGQNLVFDEMSEEPASELACVPSQNPEHGAEENNTTDIEIITKEAMTLAHRLTSGKHSKYGIVDESYNRWSFRDRDGLPDWFLDDENKHSRPVRPITAEAAAAIKEKMRAMNARPIKKVREAKARKKFKMVQKLEKLKKKTSMLAEEEGTTEREKASAISKLLSRASKAKPKKKVTVVVARGINKGKGRPKGVKGRYKIVDARMKKDLRAAKRLEKSRR